MSNELSVLDIGLPSYLKEIELDAATKALMGSGGGGSLKRISIKGGVWRMMVNGKEIAKNEERSMNVVVVAAAPKVSRTFYLKQYTEGSDVTSPDCWSADGEVPDEKAAIPQAKRCMDCPQNIKGSGQGDSRACRYSQRLAVVLANDIKGDVFQLTLPAASVFGEGAPGKWPLQTYAKMIGGKGIPITAVVTEMRFDTDSATPKLTFKPVKVLGSDEHEIVIAQGNTDAAKKAITMTVAEVDGAKVKPAPQITSTWTNTEDGGVRETRSFATPKAAEPAPEPTEPTKRVAKKEEPAEKRDLSKILAAWDDE
jgi:hypothetical protein